MLLFVLENIFRGTGSLFVHSCFTQPFFMKLFLGILTHCFVILTLKKDNRRISFMNGACEQCLIAVIVRKNIWAGNVRLQSNHFRFDPPLVFAQEEEEETLLLFHFPDKEFGNGRSEKKGTKILEKQGEAEERK